MTDDVVVAHSGPIATITLNRAQQNNTLTSAVLERLEAVARGFSDDEDTRAVILRADGDHFSFGADISEMSTTPQPSLTLLRRQAELGARVMRSLRDIHQPTVCAIQGVSTGGATCLASACDFRIAGSDARLGYGEVKLGINLMWHGLPPCVHLIGPARAKQMIMSGRLIPATTLAAWGFVDEVVDPNDLDARAEAWAAEYAALPPMAVQMIKRSVNRLAGALDEAVMHADADQWLLTTRSADFQEALTAFGEKRPPVFTGD